jgi:hypothetical protein
MRGKQFIQRAPMRGKQFIQRAQLRQRLPPANLDARCVIGCHRQTLTFAFSTPSHSVDTTASLVAAGKPRQPLSAVTVRGKQFIQRTQLRHRLPPANLDSRCVIGGRRPTLTPAFSTPSHLADTTASLDAAGKPRQLFFNSTVRGKQFIERTQLRHRLPPANLDSRCIVGCRRQISTPAFSTPSPLQLRPRLPPANLDSRFSSHSEGVNSSSSGHNCVIGCRRQTSTAAASMVAAGKP